MLSSETSPAGPVMLPPAEDAYHGHTKTEQPEMLEASDIELLGRQRPATLPTAVAEISFITAIVLSTMMSEYSISGFNIVLPPISTDLNIPLSARTWPSGVINLTTAALLLPCARLCDRYGARVVFLSGQAWLCLWSLVCGFSQNTIMLIVCRALQGLGAAAFMPAGIALLGQTYRPGPRKNLVFGLYGAFACIGFYMGILLGAICGQLLTWRWYFYIGTIMAFAVVVLGVLSVPRNGVHDVNARMDWWGVGTIVPGLVLVVFAFTDGSHAPRGWSEPYIYVTLIIGVLFLCAAVYVEGWVSEQPLLPAELFRPKYMKRLSATLFFGFGVYGTYLFYASFYIENVLHVQPLLAAAYYTPLAVGGMCLAVGGGFLLHQLSGQMLVIISGCGFCLSATLMALIPEQSDTGEPSLTFIYWAYIFVAMLCQTIGVDILFNVANIFVTTSVPLRMQNTAGALTNSLLYLGMAFWLGITEMVVGTANDYSGDKLDLRSQYKIGFWTMLGMGGACLLLSPTLRLSAAASDLTADEKNQLKAQEEKGLEQQTP